MKHINSNDCGAITWDAETKYWRVNDAKYDEILLVRSFKYFDGVNVTIYHDSGRVTGPRPVLINNK